MSRQKVGILACAAVSLALLGAGPPARADHPIGSFRSLHGEVVLTATGSWFSVQIAGGYDVEAVREAVARTPLLGDHEVHAHSEVHRFLLVELHGAPRPPGELVAALMVLERDPAVTWALAGAHTPDGKPLGVTDGVLVLLREQTAGQREAVDRAARAYGGRVVARMPYDDGVLVRVSSPRLSLILDLCAHLRRLPGVEDAHPDFVRLKERRKTTNDPYLGEQWYLDHIGTFQAWNQTMGSAEVIIAMIDDGCDWKHEDLNVGEKIVKDKMWDFTSGDSDPTAGEHGTAVGGIMAAAGDNGKGIAGVCPGCRFLPCRWGWSDWDTIESFKHVGDAGSAAVNNSWGMSYPSSSLKSAIYNLTQQGRGGLGTLVLFAAGNDGSDIDLIQDISAAPGAIAISSVSSQDKRRSYSNFGKSVDLAAPADWQYTTDNTGGSGYSWGSYTDSFGGTSGACPVVTGAAGLVFSVNPQLTESDVRNILYETAVNIGDPYYYGNGRLDVQAAVAMAAGVEPGSLVGNDDAPPAPPPGDGGVGDGGDGGDGGGGGGHGCTTHCWGQSCQGCWCDLNCIVYGDCCANVCDACGLHCGADDGGDAPPPGGGDPPAEDPPVGGDPAPAPPPAAGLSWLTPGPQGSCAWFVDCSHGCTATSCVDGCAAACTGYALASASELITCVTANACFVDPAGIYGCAAKSCPSQLAKCEADNGPGQPSPAPQPAPPPGGNPGAGSGDPPAGSDDRAAGDPPSTPETPSPPSGGPGDAEVPGAGSDAGPAPSTGRSEVVIGGGHRVEPDACQPSQAPAAPAGPLLLAMMLAGLAVRRKRGHGPVRK